MFFMVVYFFCLEYYNFLVDCEMVKRARAHRYQVFLENLCLLHCVLLYICRLCSGPVCKATWRYFASYSVISRFVIDFLTIRKVRIFSAIATDDHHPTPYGHVLYTKMLQIA